jgi:hypothetical protein
MRTPCTKNPMQLLSYKHTDNPHATPVLQTHRKTPCNSCPTNTQKKSGIKDTLATDFFVCASLYINSPQPLYFLMDSLQFVPQPITMLWATNAEGRHFVVCMMLQIVKRMIPSVRELWMYEMSPSNGRETIM